MVTPGRRKVKGWTMGKVGRPPKRRPPTGNRLLDFCNLRWRNEVALYFSRWPCPPAAPEWPGEARGDTCRLVALASGRLIHLDDLADGEPVSRRARAWVDEHARLAAAFAPQPGDEIDERFAEREWTLAESKKTAAFRARQIARGGTDPFAVGPFLAELAALVTAQGEALADLLQADPAPRLPAPPDCPAGCLEEYIHREVVALLTCPPVVEATPATLAPREWRVPRARVKRCGALDCLRFSVRLDGDKEPAYCDRTCSRRARRHYDEKGSAWPPADWNPGDEPGEPDSFQFPSLPGWTPGDPPDPEPDAEGQPLRSLIRF